LAAACAGPDYSLVPEEGGGEGDLGAATASHELGDGTSDDGGAGTPTATHDAGEIVQEFWLSFDVALQWTSWGDSLQRCQIQLAILEQHEGDGLWGPVEGDHDDPGHAGGEQEAGRGSIELPETPGTCLYTDLRVEDSADPTDGDPSEGEPGDYPEYDCEEHDDDQEGDDHEGDDHEDDQPDGTVAGCACDNWQISGSLYGPEEVFLHGRAQVITLTRHETGEDGQLRYEWDDCSPDAFPLGEVFDLELPDGPVGTTLPALWVEEAVAIGPGMTLTEPEAEILDNNTLVQPVTDSLDAAWAFGGVTPTVRGEPMTRELHAYLRNHPWGDAATFEAIACLPESSESTALTIPAELLGELQVNPDASSEQVYAAFQVDDIYQSPAFLTEWGQSVRVQSTVTEGGTVILHEE